uniref:Putative secreted protein n=1 Tax=Amblyomma cajennense TaxID=34607 RepID=A0A023FF70_AMBCJ
MKSSTLVIIFCLLLLVSSSVANSCRRRGNICVRRKYCPRFRRLGYSGCRGRKMVCCSTRNPVRINIRLRG